MCDGILHTSPNIHPYIYSYASKPSEYIQDDPLACNFAFISSNCLHCAFIPLNRCTISRPDMRYLDTPPSAQYTSLSSQSGHQGAEGVTYLAQLCSKVNFSIKSARVSSPPKPTKIPFLEAAAQTFATAEWNVGLSYSPGMSRLLIHRNIRMSGEEKAGTTRRNELDAKIPATY